VIFFFREKVPIYMGLVIQAILRSFSLDAKNTPLFSLGIFFAPLAVPSPGQAARPYRDPPVPPPVVPP